MNLKEILIKLTNDLGPDEFAMLTPGGVTLTKVSGDKEISKMIFWTELEQGRIDVGLMMLDRMRQEMHHALSK